jgi:hypothetical protein
MLNGHSKVTFLIVSFNSSGSILERSEGRRGRDCIVVGFTLPVQSVSIITKVVSSNPVHGEVYSIQHYVIKVCQLLATSQWFSPGTPPIKLTPTI